MKCKKLSALVCIGIPDLPAAKFLELREFHDEEPLKRYVDFIGHNLHPKIRRQLSLRIVVYQAGRNVREYLIGDLQRPYVGLSRLQPTMIFGYVPSVRLELNNNKEVLGYLHKSITSRHLEIVERLPDEYIGEF